MKHTPSLLLVSLISVACHTYRAEQPTAATPGVKYATGFSIERTQQGTLVTVSTPFPGATQPIRYLLVSKGAKGHSTEPGVTVVEIPVETLVCTSTTHIPMLDYLNASDKLVGFPTLDYISSPITRARIDSGLVAELGIDKGMNIEKIALLRPSVIMAYSMTGDLGQYKKIEELGIPVLLNAEYLESHPLGRAEWIRFMGLLVGKEKEADSVFTAIATEYERVKALAQNQQERPVVLSGIVYGDSWFLPGGRNYAARLFEDAGCKYLYGDDTSSGFLQLSFESVYSKAADVDLWLGVGSYPSRKALAEADERYARLRPFIDNKVFSYEARKGAKGGNEYLELGYLRPDIILKDLVKIAHPQALPGHELYFYLKIE
jgi:iron complex transport system substrate-binding protein